MINCTLCFVLSALLCFASVSSGMSTECGPGTFLKNAKCQKCPPGTFQENNNATTCTPCPPGTYNPYRGAQGRDVCIECKQGTFNAQAGATSRKACKKCASGKVSPPGSPSCISCPAGKFISSCNIPWDGSMEMKVFRGVCFGCVYSFGMRFCDRDGPVKLRCADCAADTFSKGRNSFECQACPKDTTSVKGATACAPRKPCPPGSEPKIGGGCTKCNSLTFSKGGVSRCESCPPGYVANAKREKCVACPEGTFKGEDDFNCRKCKPGTNSSAKGATFCVTDGTPCPPNFFRDRNGACSQCTNLQRFDKKKNKCVRCPERQVSTGGLDTKCTPCPQTTVFEESEYRAGCYCKPGWGYGDGEGPFGGKCKKCRPGTASELGFYCKECPKDTYAPSSGLELCLPCPRGTRQPFLGQTKCIREPPCRNGLVKSTKGFCVVPSTNCSPNHKRMPLYEVEEPICVPRSCPKGTGLIKTYNDMFDLIETCSVCSTDEFYDAKSRKCESCDFGVSAGGLSQICNECTDGKVNIEGKCRCGSGRKMMKGRCVACPPGTSGYPYTAGCDTCAAGTFAKEKGQTYCTMCREGTFSEAGAKSCKPCPEGTTTFGMGGSECLPELT